MHMAVALTDLVTGVEVTGALADADRGDFSEIQHVLLFSSAWFENCWRGAHA
jgi:hypothetical protein